MSYTSSHHTFTNLARLPPSSATSNRTRRTLVREAVRDEGYLYSTQLREHTGCVNAIALSNGEGRYLASGGDDTEVLIWDLHSDLSPSPPIKAKPAARFAGHQANIFGITFSSTNAHVYSSGLDGLVHRYDLSRLGSGSTSAVSVDGPERSVHVNESTVRGISSHPDIPNLLLVAREDHRIYLHDFRLGSTVVHRMASAHPWSGVSWSPVGGHLFGGCDEGGGLRLFDVRKSFETPSSSLRVAAQALRGAVVEYLTPKRIFSDLAGFSFSPYGNVLATNVLGYYPIVYSVGDSLPIAVLTTPEKQYRNRCTVKHGGFGPIGKDGETTYVTGSDDFYGYGWTIPSPDVLADVPVEASGPRAGEPKWLDHAAIWAPEAVPEGFHPHEIHHPSIRVGGHNSIVNSALLHPYLPLLVTSGVESRVHLHSPFPFPSSTPVPVPTPPSRIPGGPYTLEWREETNDWETLLSFDRLVYDEEKDGDYEYRSEESEEEDGEDGEEEGMRAMGWVHREARDGGEESGWERESGGEDEDDDEGGTAIDEDI